MHKWLIRAISIGIAVAAVGTPLFLWLDWLALILLLPASWLFGRVLSARFRRLDDPEGPSRTSREDAIVGERLEEDAV
jgi:membrane protein implicated in regulation of membrane protease activity